jgi:hypothetical protein
MLDEILGKWINRFEGESSSWVTLYSFLPGGRFRYFVEKSIAGDSATGQVTAMSVDGEEGTYKALGDAEVELVSKKKGSRIARMSKKGTLTIDGLEFHPFEGRGSA